MVRGRGSKRSLTMRTSCSGYQQFRDRRTGQWVYTHRRVAGKMVGGKIYLGREVHHIDHDKRNNQPSNLTIVSKAQHRRIHRRK